MSPVIPALAVTSDRDCMLEGLVNGISTCILVYTGAATLVLNKDLWDKAKGRGPDLRSVAGRKLVGVQGKPLNLYGSAPVQVQLATEGFSIEVMVVETPTADLILGRDFLRNQECATNKTWVVQGKSQERTAVMIARALVQPQACSIPLRLLNPRDVEITIPKGAAVAELEGIAAGVLSEPGDMGIAVVSADEGAVEPTAAHRQKLWEMVEQSALAKGRGNSCWPSY